MFDEIATLFASTPAPEQVLEFQPSEESRDRANELLELANADQLDAESRSETTQIENSHLLMQTTNATILNLEQKLE